MMSKKWDKVMRTLGYLYERYYKDGDIHDALEDLMKAYDEWLDGEEDR